MTNLFKCFPVFFSAWIVTSALALWWSPRLRWLALGLVIFTVLRIRFRDAKVIKKFAVEVTVPQKVAVDTELMFFMHGWPDCGQIWEPLIEHFSKKYICVSYDMPQFNHSDAGFDWGYNFDELTDCLAMTLQDALSKHQRESCILVLHDWGSVVGCMLQRKYPSLVHRMIIHDVAVPIGDAQMHNALIPVVLPLALSYQWWLALAFLTSSLPILGPPIGNAMTRAMTTGMEAPLCQTQEGYRRTTALMNYPYLYFSLYYIAEHLRLMPFYDVRQAIPMDALRKVPTLFLYATKIFHPKAFEQELRERPDCDAIRVKKDGVKLTHWFMFEHPDVALPLIDSWLLRGVKQGDYTREVTGF